MMNLNVEMSSMWSAFLTWLVSMLPRLAASVLLFGLGWWLSNVVTRLMRRAVTRAKGDAGVTTFLSSLLNILLKVIISIMAIAQLGVDVTSLIAAIGTAGLAVGLAMKDNMSNVASGAQIVLTGPFHVGDYLSVPAESVEGTVERIEMMYTTLRTFDNKEVVLPNMKLTSSTIVNYTAMKTRRLDLTYSVSYSTDLDQAKALLTRLCEEEEKIEKDPVPLIAVGEYGDSSIAIVVKVWCKIENYWDAYYAMQGRVKQEFDKVGIEIPFPQLDVHFPEKETPGSP
ncbi:MAG: mechanosensitive ion channel family protein [Clostridiales bacterium]|nr:mechanosensitive ion channel family protein [Clostridiales bacterium]